MTAQSARSLAYKIVRRFDSGGARATEVLAAELGRTADRQRCTDLVLGTLRHRAAIDHVLASLGGRPVDRISAQLRCVLRVALYELCYCPQTPEYALVHEAVEETKHWAGRKQVGFVNGVLRQVGRRIADRQASAFDRDPRTLLVTGPGQGCAFLDPLLPHPDQAPGAYLAIGFSLPGWLVQSWLDAYGFARARAICMASNRRPSMSLRVNPLRTTETRFGAALAAQGFNPTLCEPGLFQVRAPGAISEIPGFAEGHFSIQDQAAFQVAQRMAPRATWRILDLCAAPGGKSTHLAELTEDRATIYATDRDAKRLRRVRENADRLRLASVNTLAWQSAQQGGPFDAVLLDVPCSNTGVLAKRIEVRYRLTPSVCEALRATQLDLLVRAADLVTEEGLICYSTCSVQPQENETLVRAFLAQDGRYRLREECLMLPSADAPDHDGGYVAILARACGSPD